jgi:cysteine-rich repeat protein
LLALVALTSNTAAQGRVDQETTCNDGGSAQILFYEPIAQRFVPMAPNLIGVEVMLGRFNAPYSDTLTMRITEDSVGGAFVAATTEFVSASAPLAWYRFDFASPIPVAPGASYVIALDASNPSLGWQHQYELPPRCSYPDGEEIVLGQPVDGLDASFRTYSLCGNGVVDVGEECDDGNTNGQDGCTNHCTICGNGVVRAPEECDDHNRTNGDGCDADCTITACGNGIKTNGEACDDGNTYAGDCCSPTCQRESEGSPCLDDGNVCTDDVCNAAGECKHLGNTAPCSDANVCNGLDFCSGGACSVHAGNPCGTQPECQQACVPVGSFQYRCTLDDAGTECSGDGVACTADACNGLGRCTHTPQPNGSSCEDGDLCTTGDTCQAGGCRPGGGVQCGPCLTCSAGTCVKPAAACASAAPGKSSILLRNLETSTIADKVQWKWRSTASVDKTDFGAPTSTTDLTLCVYDQGGLMLAATAPGGGTCAGKPCWVELLSGYRYVDRDASPDGLLKVQARMSKLALPKITVKGRGASLKMLRRLPLSGTVTVRLKRNDGPACWESVYTTPGLNDPAQFKARN